MESLKVFQFKGLNLRQSQVNKPSEYAEDCDNVLLNSKRELVKRYGYDEDILDSDILDTLEYVAGNKLLFLKADGLYEDIAGTITLIPYGGAATTFTGIVDYDEYAGVVYIADSTGTNNLWKYDGKNFYRASLPKPDVTSVTSNAGANTYYVRIFYGYIDYQGSLIFGDYYQQEVPNSTGAGWTINLNTLNLTEFPYLVSGLRPDGNTILPPFIYMAVSENETYGYKLTGFLGGVSFYGPYILPTDYVDHSLAADTLGPYPDAFASFTEILDDYYDPTLVKGLPPDCKYITFYGETMVLANKITTALTQSRTADYKSSIFWSDTGVGSTVETFPPFNRQEVGRTSEGEIKGLFSDENELTILKDFQVYYINGILIERAFRLTNSLSAGIGCVSHKSIVGIEKGCLFQSARGIYFAGRGISPIEISDLIEPLFTEDLTGLDLSKTRGIRDSKNERVYFFIPATLSSDNIVLVYDYYYKEWFKFSNYEADEGLNIINNEIYHCNGSSIFKWSSSYNDDGAAISAFYKSVYHHFGVPGLLKKFSKIILYSINALTWVCNVKSQKNWKDVDDTDLNISFTPDLDVEDKPLNMSNARSLSVIIGNSTLNEEMVITGYEIEYDLNQMTVKGDS